MISASKTPSVAIYALKVSVICCGNYRNHSHSSYLWESFNRTCPNARHNV